MVKIIIFLFLFIFTINNSFAETEYYLTLRSNKVNLRQGPSLNHPIKLVYNKKFLPVLILDKSYNFRKIKDHENNTGWVHISQLSKKKAAITIEEDQIIFNRPSIFSKPLVVVKKGKLCKVQKCEMDWCKVKVEDYKGWIKKNSLWGLF